MAFLVVRIDAQKDPFVHPFQEQPLRVSIFRSLKTNIWIFSFLLDNFLIAVQGYLVLPSPCLLKYSDKILVLFPPQHLLYHPPASFPDNSIRIVAVVVGVLVILLMSQVWAQPKDPT